MTLKTDFFCFVVLETRWFIRLKLLLIDNAPLNIFTIIDVACMSVSCYPYDLQFIKFTKKNIVEKEIPKYHDK